MAGETGAPSSSGSRATAAGAQEMLSQRKAPTPGMVPVSTRASRWEAPSLGSSPKGRQFLLSSRSLAGSLPASCIPCAPPPRWLPHALAPRPLSPSSPTTSLALAWPCRKLSSLSVVQTQTQTQPGSERQRPRGSAGSPPPSLGSTPSEVASITTFSEPRPPPALFINRAPISGQQNRRGLRFSACINLKLNSLKPFCLSGGGWVDAIRTNFWEPPSSCT